MPTPFPISKEDVLRGRSGKPGTYTLVVKSLETKPGSNDPQSNTIWIHLVIEAGPDAGVIGAPVVHYLSEKAPGMAVPFIEAVTGKAIPEGGAVPDLDLAIGRRVKATMEYDVKYKNWKCLDFMPVSGKIEGR